MSSTELTASNINTVNRLVREASLHGPLPDIAHQMEAAHTAATEELRAVVYDAVFRVVRPPSARVH